MDKPTSSRSSASTSVRGLFGPRVREQASASQRPSWPFRVKAQAAATASRPQAEAGRARFTS